MNARGSKLIPPPPPLPGSDPPPRPSLLHPHRGPALDLCHDLRRQRFVEPARSELVSTRRARLREHVQGAPHGGVPLLGLLSLVLPYAVLDRHEELVLDVDPVVTGLQLPALRQGLSSDRLSHPRSALDVVPRTGPPPLRPLLLASRARPVQVPPLPDFHHPGQPLRVPARSPGRDVLSQVVDTLSTHVDVAA